MINEIDLNTGKTKIWTKEEINSQLLENTTAIFRQDRRPMPDGYYFSAGLITIEHFTYTYNLYTPKTDMFERWIGFNFAVESKVYVMGAIIHNPHHYVEAYQRLCGRIMDGMPYTPHLIAKAKSCDQFPCLISTQPMGPFLPPSFDARAEELKIFSPVFALGVINMFNEF